MRARIAIAVIICFETADCEMNRMGNSRFDHAKLEATNIAKAANCYYARNGTTKGLDLQALVTGPRPCLEGGNDAIMSPYGEPFVLEVGPEPDKNAKLQVEVYFKTPEGNIYDSKGRRR